MESVGNKVANAYYEFSLGQYGTRINSMSSDNQRRQFINVKYTKKNYVPQGKIEPVKMLYECRQKGVSFNPSYMGGSQAGSSQNIPVKQPAPVPVQPVKKPVLRTLGSFNVFDDSNPNSAGRTPAKKDSVDIFETTPQRKGSFNLMSDTPPKSVTNQGFNNGFIQANSNQGQQQNSNPLMGNNSNGNMPMMNNPANNNMGMMGQNNMGMMNNGQNMGMMNNGQSMGMMNNGQNMNNQQNQFGMLGANNQNLNLQRNISSNSNASYGGMSNNSGSTMGSYNNGVSPLMSGNMMAGNNNQMGSGMMGNGLPQNNSGLNNPGMNGGMGLNMNQQDANKYAALDRLTMNPQQKMMQQQQQMMQQQYQMNNGMGMGANNMGMNGGAQGFNNTLNGNGNANMNNGSGQKPNGFGMGNNIAWN